MSSKIPKGLRSTEVSTEAAIREPKEQKIDSPGCGLVKAQSQRQPQNQQASAAHAHAGEKPQ